MLPTVRGGGGRLLIKKKRNSKSTLCWGNLAYQLANSQTAEWKKETSLTFTERKRNWSTTQLKKSETSAVLNIWKTYLMWKEDQCAGVKVKLKKAKSLHIKNQKSITKNKLISRKMFARGLIFAESALQGFW